MRRTKKKILRIPTFFTILPALACLLSTYLLLSDGGIFTLVAQKREIENLKKKIEKIDVESKEIEYRIELIKKQDEKYLDYIFRKFGWVKKDEKVLKLE